MGAQTTATTQVINIVITVMYTGSGTPTTVSVIQTPPTGTGTTATPPGTSTATPPGTSTATPPGSSTATPPGTSTAGGAGSTSSGGAGSTSTSGCVSQYAQATTTMSGFTQPLLQVEAVYKADHAAGVLSDSVYQAGRNNLLGMGLDAEAAHDMIQIGGDAANITAQIATVQAELAGVTNADVGTPVAQMQGMLATVSNAVTASGSCAVSVPQ